MKSIFILLFALIVLSPCIAQDEVILSDKRLPGNDTIWVYKPKQFDATKQYPAVYLLHGWSDSYKAWPEFIDLQKLADDFNFIVICPDGFFDSYYVNSPKVKNVQFEKFFVKNLYPTMLKKYPIDKNNATAKTLNKNPAKKRNVEDNKSKKRIECNLG